MDHVLLLHPRWSLLPSSWGLVVHQILNKRATLPRVRNSQQDTSSYYLQPSPFTLSTHLNPMPPSFHCLHVEDYTQTGLSQSRTHDQVIQVLELVLNQRHRHGIELPKISLLNCLKCAFVVNIMQYLTSGPFSKILSTIHRERMLYVTAQRDKSYDKREQDTQGADVVIPTQRRYHSYHVVPCNKLWFVK